MRHPKKETNSLRIGEAARVLDASRATMLRIAEQGLLHTWRLPSNLHPDQQDRRFRRQDVYRYCRENGVPYFGRVDLAVGGVLFLTERVEWPREVLKLMKSTEYTHVTPSCAKDLFTAGMALVEEPPAIVVADHQLSECETILQEIKKHALWQPAIVHVPKTTAENAAEVAGLIRSTLAKMREGVGHDA